MKVSKVSLEEVGSFSKMFLEYLEGKQELKPFFQFSPDISGLKKAIDSRTFPAENRKTLVTELENQYSALSKSSKLSSNIQLLGDEKTFTITTGHQLNIFTGPLYFIFKIATVVNLAERLKKEFPSYNFVPVYWMASEDHDFEEINHFHLSGKKYSWNTDQKGAVGRFKTESIKGLLETIPEWIPVFEKAYTEQKTLAEAGRAYVNELFGENGLVVIDADSPMLKKQFSKVIKNDLFEHSAYKAVSSTNKRLEDAGYNSQAFTREVNFFYLDEERRRIEAKGDQFQVVDGGPTFTPDQMMAEIENNPERFSPNVILRPLYQETILPNIAYVGGPAEVIYWLQLKEVFQVFETDFPVLLPRNFGMVINHSSSSKMEKLNFDNKDIFRPTKQLKHLIIERSGNREHDLSNENTLAENVFEEILKKAIQIDQSLEGHVEAEKVRVLKRIDRIQKRLKSGQEKKFETEIRQLEYLKETLFPGGGLQERHDNFLNFFFHNPSLIKQFLESFDPLDFSFYQFWER